MRKPIFFCTFIASLVAVGAANAQEPRDFSQLPTQTVQLHRTGYQIVFNSPELQVGEARNMKQLAVAIASWLTRNFGLPEMRHLPRIEYASPIDIAALRSSHHALNLIGREASEPAQPDISIQYSDTSKTIYLPEGWNGSTPVELSVFVRVMARHLQNDANIMYEGAQARDETALTAQNFWLAMFAPLPLSP